MVGGDGWVRLGLLLSASCTEISSLLSPHCVTGWILSSLPPLPTLQPHSHPGGDPSPSSIDRCWVAADGVMVIDAGPGGLAGWWMERSTSGLISDSPRLAKVYPLQLVGPQGVPLRDTGLSAKKQSPPASR